MRDKDMTAPTKHDLPEPMLFTMEQALAFTGFTRTRLMAVLKQPGIRSKKFGKRRMIAADDLRAYVNGLFDATPAKGAPDRKRSAEGRFA